MSNHVHLSTTLYLFACNSASLSSSGKEYLGVWTNKNQDLGAFGLLIITKEGDHFLIKEHPGTGFEIISPATAHDGVLEVSDNSHVRFTYVKATDTLTTPNINGGTAEYRRKQ